MKHLWLILVALWLASGQETAVLAQPAPMPEAPVDAPPLRLVRLETADFPALTLLLAAADPRQPLPDNLDVLAQQLTLQEAGTPVANFSLTPQRAGIDLIILIDANNTIYSVDGEGQPTRLKKVQDALIRFATENMDPTGLDRVSVIVPDGEGGRFLLQDVRTPGALVNGILAYAPLAPAPTPLQAMFMQALDHATALQAENIAAENGRFQALFLFSDAGQLEQQLAFAELAARASALNLPIYAAILGARADANEIENVTQLTTPTNGLYLHMPQPQAADPLFALWQAHGTQARLHYQTLQMRNGRLQTPTGRISLTLTLGRQQLETSYELGYAPPQLTLLLLPGALLRQGDAPDTPATELTPQTQEVPVRVAWPDGQPRALRAVSLLVNGQPQVVQPNPTIDGEGLLLLWPLRDLPEGEVTLMAEAEDTFGLIGRSEPVTLILLFARPQLPTPTPAPTPTAVPLPVLVETAVSRRPWWLIGAGAGAALLLLLRLLLRRRKAAPAPSLPTPLLAPPPTPGTLNACLLLDERAPLPTDTERLIALPGENITLGRSPAEAHVVIDHPSISRLHARIRCRAPGEYWLYDEGSASGTYLNYQRLGLTPRLLEDGCVLQFGQVRALFRLLPEAAEGIEDREQETGDRE